jgi:hypothetical protein
MPYRDMPQPKSESSRAPVRVPTSRDMMLVTYGLAVVPFGLLLGWAFVLESNAEEPSRAFVGMLAYGVAFAWWFLQRRARFQRGAQELLETQALLNAGSYDAARDVLEGILDKYRGLGGVEATALSNLSIVVYHDGDSVRALEILEGVQRAGWCGPKSALRRIVMQNRSLYHTVLGQLDDANRCLRDARASMTAARAQATLLIQDTMIAARSGNFADVVALTGTTAANVKLQLKLMRILRAWALTKTNGAADEIRTLLEGAKPLVRGELRYLSTHWPELKQFLDENGFSEAN